MNALTLSTYIVDYNLSRIIVRNNINLLIIFIRYIKFNKMLKYKTKKCYSIQIDLKHATLADKFFKKIKLRFLIKQTFKEVFKLVYNKMKHLNYIRIYEKLIRDIYIFNMFIKLYKY